MGSVTGNSNTIAGSLVKPVAELGQLEGLRAGGDRASTMAASPSEAFDGAKAYKDAKAMNMMTVLEMHKRFHAETTNPSPSPNPNPNPNPNPTPNP